MVTTLVGGGLASAISAQAEPTDSTLNTLEATHLNASIEVQKVLDDQATQPLTTPESVSTGGSSEFQATAPLSPEEGITLTGPGVHTVTIGIPFATTARDAEVVSAAILSYDNENGSSTVPILKDDGSIQITTIIESSDAPTRYQFPLGIPQGGTITLSDDGFVTVMDAEGAFTAGISAPWAVDASGSAVDTHFELEGSVLTQVVDHSAKNAYPVVADPWAGNDLLQSAWVSYPSGYYVVNAIATSWGRTFNGLPTHASHVAELKSKLGSQAWRVDTNGGTIREQFLCHVAGNYFEPGVYNMESFRPSVYWPNQLNPVTRCNP